VSISKHLRLIFTLGIAFGLLFLAGRGHAHGVRGTTSTAKAICARVMYDDGEPMSYGAVEILAPDSALSFQTGRTDRNGLFCFQPDSQGEWKLVIGDGMGHQVRLKTSVKTDTSSALVQLNQEHNALSINKVDGIISGLALIFGLSGFFAWWRSRTNCRLKKGMERSAEEIVK